MLANCLNSIAGQKVPLGWEVLVLIVDNSADSGARQLVQSTNVGFATEYISEPRPGISLARNCALEAAIRHGADWIGFIDDDETAAPDWAMEMIAAALRHRCDIVHGHVVRLYPAKLPFFVRAYQPMTWPEGTEIAFAPTNSIFLRSWLVAGERGAIRFSERLAMTKGEDVAFSYEARLLGARLIHTNATTVYETVPQARLTLRSQQRHHAAATAALYYINQRFAHLSDAKAPRVHTVLRRLVFAALLLFTSPFLLPAGPQTFSEAVVRSTRRLAWAYGTPRGMTGWLLKPYRRLDGA